MRKKFIVRILGCVVALFLPEFSQAQTKIMEYKTDIDWSDGGYFLIGNPLPDLGGPTVATAVPIGTDFLAVSVNRTVSSSTRDDEILYIFDLKKKNLARKFDSAGRGYYLVFPSATTNSFILYYNDMSSGALLTLFNFNKRTRTWSEVITDVVDTGFAAAPSIPLRPAYFVNTVKGGNKLELHIYSY